MSSDSEKIYLECPRCRKTLAVPASAAGKACVCPCGEQIEIPQIVQPIGHPPQQPAGYTQQPPAYPPQQPPAYPPQQPPAYPPQQPPAYPQQQPLQNFAYSQNPAPAGYRQKSTSKKGMSGNTEAVNSGQKVPRIRDPLHISWPSVSPR